MQFSQLGYDFNHESTLVSIELPIGSQTLQISSGVLCLKTLDELGMLVHEFRIDPSFYEPDLLSMQDRLAFIGEPHLSGNEAVDRKSVVKGKSVSVRVDLGGRRIIKKQNQKKKIS